MLLFTRIYPGVLERYNATKLIDLIVGAEDVKIEKPNPEGLLWVVDRLGLDKKQVSYVGDSIVDVQTAQNAGVDFAGVLTGTTKKEDLFYNSVEDSLLKFAVIISKSIVKWVFCKHKERDTYEVPGGHREDGESILETAKRELQENYFL